MKKKITFALSCILLIVLISPVYSDELAAVWNRIYNSKERIDEKLIVMQKIVDLHDRNMEPVLIEALSNIVYSRDESLTQNERQRTWDLTIMIINELGNLSAADSAPVLFKVMNDAEDDFVRAAAITALGMTGGREYAEDIAEYLRYLNYEIIEIENNERRHSLVDACIFALERLKDPAGFEPVLFASVGRYSRTTTDKAEQALRNMLQDPTDVVIKILRKDSNFQMRFAALGVEDNSFASPERKTEAAAAAVEVGLIYNKTQLSDYQYMTRTRVKACEMIRDYEYAQPQAVQWLGKLLNSSENTNELITCLQALGVYESDEAVTIMAEYLDGNNDLKAAGKHYDHERVIRECINSLGKAGNTLGREALSMVEYSGWSSQTIRMAQYALSKI